MGRLSEAEFREIVEGVRSRHALSSVVERFTKLKPAGRELVGLCPFHSERSPSFRVNDGRGVFWCFGCGKTGDVFRFLQERLGLAFLDAVRWIDGAALPAVDQAELARQREDERAARLRDEADAVAFWNASEPIAGTPAETYLRNVRGVSIDLPPSLRFGEVPSWRDKKRGEWNTPRPALIAAIVDRDNRVCGVQRTFLLPDGSGKARMKRPKLSLGRIRGACVRLGPPQASVIVCEGIEDGLSLMEALPGASVWPTLGTGLMPAVEYPDEVLEIVIAGQNDEAGRTAVRHAGERLLELGFAVRAMFPAPEYKDWNDQARGMRA